MLPAIFWFLVLEQLVHERDRMLHLILWLAFGLEFLYKPVIETAMRSNLDSSSL